MNLNVLVLINASPRPSPQTGISRLQAARELLQHQFVIVIQADDLDFLALALVLVL